MYVLLIRIIVSYVAGEQLIISMNAQQQWSPIYNMQPLLLNLELYLNYF